MSLPRVSNFFVKTYETSVEQLVQKENKNEGLQEQAEVNENPKSNLFQAEVQTTNKDDSMEDEQGNTIFYNPTSTPLLWCSELYVEELMEEKKICSFKKTKTKQFKKKSLQ